MRSVEQQKNIRLVVCAVIIIASLVSSWMVGKMQTAFSSTINTNDPNALVILISALGIQLVVCGGLGYIAGQHIVRICHKPYDEPTE